MTDYELTPEEMKRAALWHAKRALKFEEWSLRGDWPEERRADFALWAEAERRNAEMYRSGQIKQTALEALRATTC